MIPVSPSSFTVAEMFDGDVMADDAKWMPVGSIGHSRPLMFDIRHGSWISVLRARGAGTIQRHRHASPVTAWTLDGTWGYREHDWIARAGSFVYEPAGTSTRCISILNRAT
jgi:2,4'-dihydroxyacetophenone dioxygenase